MGYAIRDGLLLGFSLATLFGFGPALLTLLQTSIQRGVKFGVFFSFGVFLSDLILVFLSFQGSIQVVNEPKNKLSFAIVGAAILLIFGLVTFLKKPKMDIKDIEIDKKSLPITYMLKGLLLNISNPFVWVFWLGTMIGITANYGKVERFPVAVLFLTALFTVLCVDVFKSFLAGKLRPYITFSRMRRINQVSGVGLMLFGVSLVVRALFF